MKILFLTQYFPPEVGAPQNRLYELAVLLKKKGVDITVLTAMPNYPKMEVHERYRGKYFVKEEREGLTIFRTYIFVSKNKSVLYRLLNYFSFVFSSAWFGGFKLNGKYDFVFCESPPLFLGFSALWICWIKKARLIFNVSDLWPESAEKLGLVKNKLLLNASTSLEELLYKRSALITGQTMGIVRNISSRFPDKKVYWLPNGADLSFFQSNQELKTIRNKYVFGEGDFILLYAGIIGYAQGLEIIIKAAENLKEITTIKFILAGDGPVKEELVRMTKDKALTNVYFIDSLPKSEMPSLINSIDAAIIPLRKLDLFKGAIPSKIFETLAMEKPVLLGVEGEAKELFVTEGNCALAFEPENHEDLVKQILVIYKNKELARKIGVNGRKFVAEKFSREKITADFYNQLKQLC